MCKSKGFTLIELLVVISIIALLIGILLPALGAARATARRMESNTRIRGISQAYAMWASENDGVLPGMFPDGTFIVSDDPSRPSPHLAGAHAGTRMRLVVLYDYAPSLYLISPLENKEAWEQGVSDGFDGRHYSYSVLGIVSQSDDSSAGRGGQNRKNEWMSGNMHSQVPIVSDRAFDPGTFANPGGPNSPTISSLYTPWRSGDWQGGIAFGDGHVNFSDTHVIETRVDGVRNPADSLFSVSTPVDFFAGIENQAVMTWFGRVNYTTSTEPEYR